jgi:hypothetical protein
MVEHDMRVYYHPKTNDYSRNSSYMEGERPGFFPSDVLDELQRARYVAPRYPRGFEYFVTPAGREAVKE